ncbi:pimeloyl-ACP methyl ester carboxylesterase [Motilibacter peucedani]|uniref:Pimeloyl-ACP methyl ester carboxylesterase n=1 Tax=Motilibacter peucedani TaxID=598650 RepID=A0A420XNU2_9ACTN|nr:alpha/beta hydrolase [Motilibacter peucedani]RKS73854.1 pimeloyl-ACP methyl ester carboxylesterase [Motilibacter peucedani]
MQRLQLDDVEICAEAFGDPALPTLVLLSGASSSMDAWPPDLCRQLAAAGRHVVRFDPRDTGASTTGPPGEPDYDGAALSRDALEVVRQLGRGPAHLVGVSMGGGIAQDLALRHPELVASVTLVATTAVGGVDAAGPPPEPALQARFAAPPPDPDWHDREAVVEHLLEGARAYAGPLGTDEDDVRAGAVATFGRSPDMAAAGNHWRVSGTGDGPELDVHDIRVPTLVVHGTHDPLFPLPHGRSLAAAVPGARLLVLEGMGHQVPPRSTWPEFVPAVLEVTGR